MPEMGRGSTVIREDEDVGEMNTRRGGKHACMRRKIKIVLKLEISRMKKKCVKRLIVGLGLRNVGSLRL